MFIQRLRNEPRDNSHLANATLSIIATTTSYYSPSRVTTSFVYQGEIAWPVWFQWGMGGVQYCSVWIYWRWWRMEDVQHQWCGDSQRWVRHLQDHLIGHNCGFWWRFWCRASVAKLWVHHGYHLLCCLQNDVVIALCSLSFRCDGGQNKEQTRHDSPRWVAVMRWADIFL